MAFVRRARHLSGMVSLALVLIGVVARAEVSAQTLDVRVEGDHFTVNGKPQFLILLSYFDAMNASATTLNNDFHRIKELNIDGVRIFPNWWDYGCSGTSNCFTASTLMSAGSSLRPGRMTKLREVLDIAKQHGLIVDISFARETVCDTFPSAGSACPSPLTQPNYMAQIKDVLAQLAGDPNPNRFKHVIVDFQNEYDDGGNQTLTDANIQDLADWVHGNPAADATRPVTASKTANGPAATAIAANANRLDIATYHDPRNSTWAADTGGVVDNLRSGGKPAYLQEPMPFGSDPNRPDDDLPDNFKDAVKAAALRGAAAWTFHTRSAFRLGSSTYQDTADATEEGTAYSLRGEVNAACAATVSAPSPSIVPSSGGSVTVNVTIPQLCGYDVSTTTGWIHVAPNQRWHRGSGTVTVTVDPYTSGSGVGSITVAGQSVQIVQQTCAAPSIGPSTALAVPSSKSYAANVTATAGCSWSVTSDQPWLTISSGGSGTGNGTVTYTVSANHSIAQRTAHLTVGASTLTLTQKRAPKALDFDGDAIADLAVFDPSTNIWHIRWSGTGTGTTYAWGLSGDILKPGDYDGDGRSDVAIWRPSDGSWHILLSTTNYTGAWTPSFGSPGMIPAPADFDGDGKIDLAMYYPANGNWYISLSAGGTVSYAWGLTNDIPVPADYDGDGRADIAIWRPSDGYWHILLSTTNYTGAWALGWGSPGMKPTPADYDGDGMTDLATYYPANGTWYVRFSTGGGQQFSGGIAADYPESADFDGDGIADVTQWRTDGTWHILLSSSGFTNQWHLSWGSPGMVPVHPVF